MINSAASFKGGSSQTQDLNEILYPRCFHSEHAWQMSHAERCALAAVLERFRPQVSIEVGTYRGGSLSLISQYSDLVYSLDTDPDVPRRLQNFRNVRFLTGPSNTTLPDLLLKLVSEAHPLTFVLIDGDHSENGVRQDVESILSYVPDRPLAIAMHDSFNPGCRKGIREAGWEACPYVQVLHLDFVPGVIVNQPGGPFDGTMWGGLALALLHPVPRPGDLPITASSEKTFQACVRSVSPSPHGNPP